MFWSLLQVGSKMMDSEKVFFTFFLKFVNRFKKMCWPEKVFSLILSIKKRNFWISIYNSFFKLYFKAKIFLTYPKTNWLSHIFDFARKNIHKLSRNVFFRFDAAKLFTSLLVTNVFFTILFIFIILSLVKSDWGDTWRDKLLNQFQLFRSFSQNYSW